MYVIKFLDNGELYDACAKLKYFLVDDFLNNYGRGIYEFDGNKYICEKATGIKIAEVIKLFEIIV